MADEKFSMSGIVAITPFGLYFPFSTLTVEKDSIILSTLFKNYIVEKSSITVIKEESRMLHFGARIVHAKSDYPKYLFFSPWLQIGSKMEKLMSFLKSLGYPTEK
jgi:hypothetical protein